MRQRRCDRDSDKSRRCCCWSKKEQLAPRAVNRFWNFMMLLQVANNSECICLHWQREGAGGDHVRGHWGTSSDCQREANQTTNWFGVKSMQRQEGAGRGGAVRVFCQLTWLVNLSVSLSVVGFAFYFPFAHYLRQRDSGTDPGGGGETETDRRS